EYVNGYLFYCKGPDLFAQKFDVSKFELQGEARRIASDVGLNYGDVDNRAFTIAAGGTIAVSSQPSLAASQLTWFDRSGKQLDRAGDPGSYFGVAAAPDYKKVIMERLDPQSGASGAWLLEFSTGITSKLKVINNTPVWAGSDRIVYIAEDGSMQALNINSGKNQTVLASSSDELSGAFLQSVSPDGRFLVWTKSSSGQSDPWIVPLDGSKKPARFLDTPSNEFRAEI